jgi:CxxC motif-containing protein
MCKNSAEKRLRGASALIKEYCCIICPNGCDIVVTVEQEKILSVEGNLCPKGMGYVENELKCPMRTIATSILLEQGALPLVSVRLTAPIPKEKIFAVMEELKKIRLKAPVFLGEVVLKNILGLSSNVIITKNVEKMNVEK